MRGLVAIVGPTAVGKSRLALGLAQALGGEIVNADSRQVYRYLDIGTAKPTPQERDLVPHHLLDLVAPDQEFSLALYLPLARRTVEDIQGQGRLPILVGGSGQYAWAMVEGWQVPPIPPNPQLRQQLEARVRQEGPEKLYTELRSLDPEAARQIAPQNARRIIRALEVCLQGIPFSRLQTRNPPPYSILILGLTTSRHELYRRIDRRVEEMLARGWVEEVKGLMEKGYSQDLPSLSSFGYRELVSYLKGEIDLPTASQRIKYQTHRFARQQYAWFRLHDPRIHWLEAGGEALSQARELVATLWTPTPKGDLVRS